MTPKLPVPTDNIYKFLTLFGLTLIALSLTLAVLNVNFANEEIWRKANAYFDLQAEVGPSKAEREKLILNDIDRLNTDREVGKWFLSGIFIIGFCMSIFGFYKWIRKVQPAHDELLELEREKLRLEIQALKKSSQVGSNERCS